jgi:glycosyltransferase involved in cell wall biosynthesis
MSVPSCFGYKHLAAAFKTSVAANYVYAHVPHSGSTETLRRLWVLERRCGLFPGPLPHVERLQTQDFGESSPWENIEQGNLHRFVSRFQAGFRFSIVRNPYTRLHAAYRSHIEQDTSIGRGFRRALGQSAGQRLSFAEFIASLASLPDHERHPVFSAQADWMMWDYVPFDFIGCVESYASDYIRIAERAISQETIGNQAGYDSNAEKYDFSQGDVRKHMTALYGHDFAGFGYSDDPDRIHEPASSAGEQHSDKGLYMTPFWVLVDSKAQLLLERTAVAIDQIERTLRDEEAKRSSGFLPQLRMDLARILDRSGNVKQARAILTPPPGESTTDIEYATAIAQLELREDRMDAALAALASALDRGQPTAAYLRMVGSLSAALQDESTAIRAGRAAVESTLPGPTRSAMVDELLKGLNRRSATRLAFTVLESLSSTPDLGFDIADKAVSLGHAFPKETHRSSAPVITPRSEPDHTLQALAGETVDSVEYFRQRLVRKVLERYPFLLDTDHYPGTIADFPAAGLSPLEHYIKIGSKRLDVEANPFFNHGIYLHSMAGSPGHALDPLVHYVVEGAPKGVDPGPFFRTARYMAEHPELAGTDENPLNHYLASGPKARGPYTYLPAHVFEGLKALSLYDTNLFPSASRLTQLAPPITTSQDRLGAIYKRISTDLPSTFSHLVLLLWVAHPGGAERVANNILRLLGEQVGPDQVVAIGTDFPAREALGLPDKVRVLSLSDYDETLTREERREIIDRIILECQPEATMIVNSTIGWMLAVGRGRFLSRDTRLYGALFSYGRTDEHGVFGLHDPLAASIDHLTGVIVDNARFPVHLETLTPFRQAERHKFHIVHTPFDPELPIQKPSIEPRPRRALWMSRMAAEKRPDILAAIARALPNREYLVYGSQIPYFPPVDISDLESLPNVVVKGRFRDLSEVAFDQCDLFLYTSQYDGLPIVLLEATAMGLPIIAPDVGGISDFINEQTGWLVSNSDAVDEYVAAIAEIESKPDLARQKVLAAQELMTSRHNWEEFRRSFSAVPGFLPV